jgi:succinate dehydrogenase/fumarate reductase flavoprotein subunit
VRADVLVAGSGAAGLTAAVAAAQAGADVLLVERGEAFGGTTALSDARAVGRAAVPRVRGTTIGTKGGPRTNPDGRALRADGSPVEGLYAVGKASAGWLGDAYPAPGATLGIGMVFGYRAAVSAARSASKVG